jgi:hypothetical protein
MADEDSGPYTDAEVAAAADERGKGTLETRVDVLETLLAALSARVAKIEGN